MVDSVGYLGLTDWVVNEKPQLNEANSHGVVANLKDVTNMIKLFDTQLGFVMKNNCACF